MSSLTPPPVPEIPAGARLVPQRACIAVVDGLPEAPIAPHLATILPGRVARVRLRMRNREGFDVTQATPASHPDTLLEATQALLDALQPTHDVLVLEGPALLACVTPRLAILGARSPSLALLDPDVRPLRERFDLVLHDFRPGALAHLVRDRVRV